MVCAPFEGQFGTGGGGGTPFNMGANGSGVKRIVTRFGRYGEHASGMDVVLLIRLEFRDGTVMERGGEDHFNNIFLKRHEHVFDVADVETITKVDVWGGWLVDGVRYETSTGRSSGVVCRMLDKDNCTTYSGDSLAGMFGGAGEILDRVGFSFGERRNLRAYYTVRVEIQQKATVGEISDSKTVECTAESEERLQKIDQSSSFRNKIFPKWSKSAKAVWNKVMDAPSTALGMQQKLASFYSTPWQVFRVVTFTFSVDGASKIVQETNHVESLENRLSENELVERAEASLYSCLPDNGVVRGYLRKSNPCVYHEDLFITEKK